MVPWDHRFDTRHHVGTQFKFNAAKVEIKKTLSISHCRKDLSFYCPLHLLLLGRRTSSFELLNPNGVLFKNKMTSSPSRPWPHEMRNSAIMKSSNHRPNPTYPRSFRLKNWRKVENQEKYERRRQLVCFRWWLYLVSARAPPRLKNLPLPEHECCNLRAVCRKRVGSYLLKVRSFLLWGVWCGCAPIQEHPCSKALPTGPRGFCHCLCTKLRYHCWWVWWAGKYIFATIWLL